MSPFGDAYFENECLKICCVSCVEFGKNTSKSSHKSRISGAYPYVSCTQIMTIGNDFQIFSCMKQNLRQFFSLKFPVFIPYRSSIDRRQPRSSAFFSTGLDEIGQFFGSSDGSAITRTWTGRKSWWVDGYCELEARDGFGRPKWKHGHYMKYLVNGWYLG